MARTPRPESVREETARIPVSSQRSPLLYRNLDTKNFQHRWVIDKDDRIQKFLEGGYEFVTATQKSVGEKTVESESQDKQGSRVTKSAGYGGHRLYLMRIPKKWYQEDQKAKQQEIDEYEQQMRHAKSGEAGVDYGKVSFGRKKKAFDDGGIQVEIENQTASDD